MSTISITTTQNIELEYELASLGERIVAGLIDLLILIGYLVIAGLLLSEFNLFTNGNAWIVILFYLPVTFYTLFNEILLNGQTVGKRIMHIKVTSLNGNQATLGQYLIRWLFRLIDIWITMFVVGIVSIAVAEKNQRLGDIVAGVILVKTKPRSSFQQTLYMPTMETNYAVSYPEVLQLSDSDVQLVKEVILTVQKGGNSMLAFQAMEKIEKVLNIQRKQYEPLVFLHTVLADYNHVTSKL